MEAPVAALPAAAATWAAALKPPGYYAGATWPPPLAEAAAALGPDIGHHSIGKYPARWLTYAAALAAVGTEEALVEAYDINRQILYYTRGDRYREDVGRTEAKYGSTIRAAAAHNAALTLAQFHARPLIAAAAREAERAAGDLFSKGRDELVALAETMAADGAALRATVRLYWGPGMTLRAADVAAAAPRIAALPAAGVEGRWGGVRHALRAYGLTAPTTPPRTHGARRPCRAYPRGGYVEVR